MSESRSSGHPAWTGRARQSWGSMRPASTVAGALHSDTDRSAPVTRTLAVTRSREVSGAPGHGTSTESAEAAGFTRAGA